MSASLHSNCRIVDRRLARRPEREMAGLGGGRPGRPTVAANPDVWAETAFILTYDENDGSFDHVPPPTAPAGTADEYVDGEPISLGFRVPTVIVSPWTVGGGVFSEVADHTSLILLLDRIFGVEEPNISAWRRQTVSDLTGALGFTRPPFRFTRPAPFPRGNRALSVPATTSKLLAAQQEAAVNPAPTVPVTNTWPVQAGSWGRRGGSPPATKRSTSSQPAEV